MSTFGSIDIDFWWNYLNEHDKRVKDLIMFLLTDQLIRKFIQIEKCESPIEQLFKIAFTEIVKLFINYQYTIKSQYEIQCSDKKYRVDFLIFIGDYDHDKDNCKKIAIECDGHDFHEKTKEQAAYDKQRDRDLMAAGCYVIHFTGSEIWNDPFKCARETINMMSKIYDDNQKD